MTAISEFSIRQAYLTGEADHHVALCSGGKDSVVATHAAMVFGPAEKVIYLNTATGPSGGAVDDNGEWIRQWCVDNGWPFEELTTEENYAELVAESGYPGPSRHFIMYNRLKDRQLCELAARVDGDLYCWTGIRRLESERRMQHSYDDNERGDGRWYWRSPVSEFTDERVEQYRQHFEIPVSDVTTEIGRSADCWCGCFGDRTELIDLEAAGYADHAEWLRSLETPDSQPREQDHWAGGNYDREDFATADDRQQTLCSSCGLDKLREAAGDD